MGIGGNFWELLKPCARLEGMNFLRDKRVAVDLSFWIIQHDAAMRNGSSLRSPRNPHLRLTFFRTVNLFSKMGAFPVFVADGEPPRLKAQARIERFCRATGLDPSAVSLPLPQINEEEGPDIKRNRFFTKCVQECVVGRTEKSLPTIFHELLELMGMPVMRASGEAEALCAQLNANGDVDFCITADSDAFLFGAKSVVKSLNSNSKEPFECYHMSDIEVNLGLKRQHLIAISLLVGNDFDLGGVPGIGIDSAVRFVRIFKEDEILQRLGEMEETGSSPLTLKKTRLLPHCERCGHPGSKRVHLSSPCGLCVASKNENCSVKPLGFKCECPACEKARLSKEQKTQENWRIRICQRISAVPDFPNKKIIDIYLNDGIDSLRDGGPSLQWQKPRVEELVDFLSYYQKWNPSYTRQRVLPMLTTIFLREAAVERERETLLCGQYEFHSIQRIKTRFFHRFYAVKWKRIPSSLTLSCTGPTGSPPFDFPSLERAESMGQMEETEAPSILVDDGSWFLVTDENMELVKAAFPGKVNEFLKEKEQLESKSNSKSKSKKEIGVSGSPRIGQTQLSITEFYRSTKTAASSSGQLKPDEDQPLKSRQGSSIAKRQRPLTSERSLSKSVRRRLLFD